MPVEIATAVVNLIPSFSGLQSSIDRQLRGVDTRRAGSAAGDGYVAGFGGAAKKLAVVVGGALAGVKLKDFAASAISNASDLAEVGSKLQAIYGSAAGDIEAFGARGAKALGQTSLQAKNAAATFGTFGKAAGLSAKENAAFSTQLATLATDMASFSNTTPEQAIEALGAGLRGESEPLRAYGVLLDDASLRQEALAMGLITTTKDALTPQQKVLASHALIMKQTGDAQGDFERTSGGLANQQRILAAQWEDSKGKLGQAFLPGVTAVVSALNEKLGPAIDGIVAGLPAFTESVKTEFGKVKGYASEAWSILSGEGFQGGYGLEEDSPVVGFLFILRDFGLETFDRLRDIWDKLWSVGEKLWPHIQSIGSSLGEAIKTLGDNGLWFGLLDVFQKLVDLMNDYMVPAFDWLARFMRENPDSVIAFVAVIGTAIAATKLWALAQAALNFVLTANPIGLIVVALAAFAAAVVWAYNNVEWFRDLVDTAWDVISTAVSWAWNNVLQPVLKYLWDRITDLGGSFAMLWDTVSNVWTWISDKVSAVWNWLRDNVFAPLGTGIQNVGGFFSDLWTTVSNVWTWIGDKIQGIWDNVINPIWTSLKEFITGIGSFFSGIWDGVKGVVEDVKGFITEITTAIDDFFGKVEKQAQAQGLTGGQQTTAGPFSSAGNPLAGMGMYADGGVLPGYAPGVDSIPAMLSPGEGILRPEVVRALGADTILGWNAAAKKNKFADGGIAALHSMGMMTGDIIKKSAKDLLAGKRDQVLSAPLFSDYGPENYSGNAINTQAAIDFIKRMFGLPDVWGWRASGSVAGSDHPKGKAIDAMIPNYRSDAGIALGTRLADWFIQNPANFGTKYVIWRDRINQNGAWSPYSHPGGTNDTLAHRDHVHISLLTGMAAATGQAVGDALAPGSGVERWRPLALQALAATGQSASNVDRMLNQIRTESSGDPNAINLWDSNAMRGIPSGGLLQVIQPTFESALRGTPFAGLIPRGRFDPWANMISSILYSLNRYGSLDRAWQGRAYAKGGIVPDFGGGADSVRAWLTPGEGVFTEAQTNAIITHARALESGYAGQSPSIQVGDIHMASADPAAVVDELMWRARVSR